MSDPYAPNDDRPVQDPHEGKIEVEPGVWVSEELYYFMTQRIEGGWKIRMAHNARRILDNLEELKRKGIL